MSRPNRTPTGARTTKTGLPDDLPREVLTVTRLAEMIAGLDGYIERRAVGLARPVIEEAERSREVSDQRVTDLQGEYGRQIAALERQLESARAKLAEMREQRDRLAKGARGD